MLLEVLVAVRLSLPSLAVGGDGCRVAVSSRRRTSTVAESSRKASLLGLALYRRSTGLMWLGWGSPMGSSGTTTSGSWRMKANGNGMSVPTGRVVSHTGDAGVRGRWD